MFSLRVVVLALYYCSFFFHHQCNVMVIGLGIPSKSNIVVITHACGRMGKLLASQIREESLLLPNNNNRNNIDTDSNTITDDNNVPPPLLIRAVVRSEEEEMSVKCDLGGMISKNGKFTFKECNWLETVIVSDPATDQGRILLDTVFRDATCAVLCDASHNEIVETGIDEWSVRIPAVESENNSKNLSVRLMAEIQAASKSSSLEHVVLRSSMGLSSDSDSDAVTVMGGEDALVGARAAEASLRVSKLDYTILRLGALTDDAGMVPLVFGRDDSLLLKQLDDTSVQRPPILSRADAARVAAFILRKKEAFVKKRMVLDCAWAWKWNQRTCAGTDEALNAAGRQDLMRAMMESIE